MVFLWELRIAGPDVAIRTTFNDFIDDDIGLFAQFDGTLAPRIFMFENTLDKQVLEVFQTVEAPKSYSALRNPVVRVKSVEWIPVLVIKTDTVVDDCETLDRRLAALKFLLVRPS